MLQPTSSAEEMGAHMDRVPPFAMFVSQDLLPLGQEALQRSSLSSDLPFYSFSESGNSLQTEVVGSNGDLPKISTLDDLMAAGKDLPPMQKTPLAAGEASRRVAYYCTTSGTSGFQVTSLAFPSIIVNILIRHFCVFLARCGHYARKHHR